MKQKTDIKTFFRYVIPSVLSFALSGVYAIVDGFFVGNSMGDAGRFRGSAGYYYRTRRYDADCIDLFTSQTAVYIKDTIF